MLKRQERVAAVTGSIVVACSVVIATTFHRRLIACSYNTAKAPPCANPADYSIYFRAAIIFAGFIIAALILFTARRYANRRP